MRLLVVAPLVCFSCAPPIHGFGTGGSGGGGGATADGGGAGTTLAPAAAAPAWAMAGGGPQRRYLSRFPSASVLHRRWSLPEVEPRAVDADGTVFTKDWRYSPPAISAIGADGALEARAWDDYTAGPVLGDDGALYAAAGATLTTWRDGGSAQAALACAPEDLLPVGDLLFLACTGAVYAYAGARLAWWSPIAGAVQELAAATDGALVVATIDQVFVLERATGHQRLALALWQLAADGPIRALQVGIDGALYLVTGTPILLFAIDPASGGVQRLAALDGSYDGFAVGADGTLFIAETALVALDPLGKPRWRWPLAAPARQPIAFSDGNVLVPWGQTAAVLLASDGHLVAQPTLAAAAEGAPAVVAAGPDGAVYAAIPSGSVLRAFGQ